MKTIEHVELNDDFCQKVWNIVYRSLQAPFFHLAAKTKVFDHLIQPKSPQELAGEMHFNPGSVKPFLDMLLSMGLVVKRGDKYVNHPGATRFLTSGGTLSHLPSYEGMMGMMYDILDNLEDILLNGPAGYLDQKQEQQHLDDQEIWSKAARSMVGGGLHQAQLLLPYLQAMPEWGSFNKMMDLGGGPGSYCMVFVSSHPTMQGVVFDQKAVVNEADQIVAEFGLQDRITTWAGDYINDPELGSGYDFVWTSSTLNFAKGRLVPLFEKIHKALKPGGVFASHHPSICGDGTEYWQMVAGFAPYDMIGTDMNFYDNEVADAMLAAGFQSVQSKDINAIHGIQRLDLARKAKA